MKTGGKERQRCNSGWRRQRASSVRMPLRFMTAESRFNIRGSDEMRNCRGLESRSGICQCYGRCNVLVLSSFVWVSSTIKMHIRIYTGIQVKSMVTVVDVLYSVLYDNSLDSHKFLLYRNSDKHERTNCIRLQANRCSYVRNHRSRT